MHTIVPDASLRPYVLIGLNYMYQPVSEYHFSSLEALAKAAAREAPAIESNRRGWFPLERQAVRQKAVNPRGKLLAVDELVAWGTRLWRESYRIHRREVFEFRRGSVPGLRDYYGGPSSRNRRTQSLKRENALVLWEDGEIAARAARDGRDLPDDRDGRRRTVQRSWKEHYKGRKNWDRPAARSKGG